MLDNLSGSLGFMSRSSDRKGRDWCGLGVPMFKSTWWEMAGELWLDLRRVEVVVQLSVFFCSFHCPSQGSGQTLESPVSLDWTQQTLKEPGPSPSLYPNVLSSP